MPPQVGGETYATSLKVNLAVAHYHLGLPFKRLESFQDLLGMPLSDATQWALVEEVADSAYPVYEHLKSLGAQQPLVYQDDTGARILSLIKENQSEPAPKRQGMYTCRLAGINPLNYLGALMENRTAVFADPAAWRPWNYRDHLGETNLPAPLRHPPPVLGQFDRPGVTVPQ